MSHRLGRPLLVRPATPWLHCLVYRTISYDSGDVTGRYRVTKDGLLLANYALSPAHNLCIRTHDPSLLLCLARHVASLHHAGNDLFRQRERFVAELSTFCSC